MTPTPLGLPTLRRPIYTQPRERFVFLYPTTVCQLRCRHCYVGNDRLNAANTMSVEYAIEVMDYFKLTGGHDKLYLLGGEPTMHPQLGEIVRAARERGYQVTISSNGEFTDEVFDAIRPEVLNSFNFSLESANPVVHRKIRGNPGNWTKVTDNIAAARERGYQVRVMTTISKANREGAFDLIPLLADLGAHTLSYHNLGKTGNGGRMLTPLTPAEWMDFCAALEALPPEPRLAVYYPPTFVPADQQAQWFERGYPGCPARTLDRPHVYPDGTVYACPVFMDNGRHFARFESGKLVLNPDPNNELNAYLTSDPGCSGCDKTDTCGGGCPAYSQIPAYDGWYSCDRDTTPLCILWTVSAWGARPADSLHALR
ncbi:radical SAM/SPASM domain-containing protein [Nocardia farcinica]|uniref:radical SAM/SPASM domain-containing protein n=1 Tax=Nocardia farcinica TaxID=37329 RepID=UPI0018932351|nr:radical SAM protein [Nocardia farcinica]MBF6574103.1 radical SAM protein [Nocardia farcinica]